MRSESAGVRRTAATHPTGGRYEARSREAGPGQALQRSGDKGLKSLTLATFKKDRSLTLERDGEGWLLVEDGFEKSRLSPAAGAAGKRLLKEAFKREFPRSANAYLAEVR